MKLVNRENHYAIRALVMMAEDGLEHFPRRQKIEKLENAMLAELAATTIGSLAREFAAGRTSKFNLEG